MRCVIFFVFAVAIATAPASSQGELEARDRLLAAAGLLEAANSASDRIAALTEAVLAYESGLSAMRSKLRNLTLRERELMSALSVEDADGASLLAMMQTATKRAQTQSLLHPGSAIDTIRAGALASTALSALQERASVLSEKLAELNEVQNLISGAEAVLSDALQDLQDARERLADALTQRENLPPRLATDEAAMDALVNSAETLSALADSLFSGGQPDFSYSEQDWIEPVQGRLRASYAPSAGRFGWSIKTESEALIVAPAPSSVRFSRALPGSGEVVILETSEDTLILMAGLSASFVEAGQVLSRGDPLGFSAKVKMSEQDKLNANSPQSSLVDDETVYIEIRQGGASVNPATFFQIEREQG